MENLYEKIGWEYFSLYLQWHITAKCPYKCKHCYLPDDSTYKSELENELDFETCCNLIDELFELANREKIKLLDITFTGGDPLLRKDLFSLIDYVQSKKLTGDKGLNVDLMSTPKSINKKVLQEIRQKGIINLQLSIDGREEIHDEVRGEGAFRELLEAMELLKEEGFPILLMFTLGKENKDELIPLMYWASENKVDLFSFSRMVPIGGAAKNYSKDLFTPEEYRNFLIEILKAQYDLELKDTETIFTLKEPLWELLYDEYGRREENGMTGCCYAGSMLTVLADGTVLPCRRLPVNLGKFPKDSITDIFYNSPCLNKIRDFSKYEKCSECHLVKSCRGNPCISYGLTGNLFSPDPQCWKK